MTKFKICIIFAKANEIEDKITDIYLNLDAL